MSRLALALLALSGCLPKRIEIHPPEWTGAPAPEPAGPSVALSYPIDARPASERRDLPRYQANNFPTLVYGDSALVPSALDAVDRTLLAALPASGIPVEPWDDADYRVRVFVLGHAGRRDMSDANWVSTVTGGLAGTVGKFVYANFAVVEARLRLEVTDRAGKVVAVRDVRSFHVERRPVGRNWGFWYLYRRAPNAEMFERAFAGVHGDLGHEVALVLDQARRGDPVVSGVPPIPPAYHFLRPWDPPDTLDVLPGEDAWGTGIAMAKYGGPAFSVLSGQYARRGEVVGRVGAPTLGYDIGLGERSQLLLDLSVLGEVNQLGAGIRWRAAEGRRTALALEERLGVDFVLYDLVLSLEDPSLAWEPRFAGVTDTVSAVGSWRTGDLSLYGRGGGALVARMNDVPDGRLLPDLDRGWAWGPLLGAGVEYQIGPTSAIAGELVGRVWIQDGAAVPGDVGPVWIVPQITLGLR